MLFANRIKELRNLCQMPQRKLAAALDIDTATYCKIERGERRAKKEQISILADLFHTDEQELLTLWLADKVSDIVSDNDVIALNALSLATQNIKLKNTNG